MRPLNLTLKRQYFEEILAGTKTIEYRICTPYYDEKFNSQRQWGTVEFHYYTSRKLVCDVLKVEKIPKPEHLQDSVYLKGTHCWAIHLANPFVKSL